MNKDTKKGRMAMRTLMMIKHRNTRTLRTMKKCMKRMMSMHIHNRTMNFNMLDVAT